MTTPPSVLGTVRLALVPVPLFPTKAVIGSAWLTPLKDAAPPTMPTSYIIDRKGVVRYIHKGFKGSKTAAEYVAEIEALLAEK